MIYNMYICIFCHRVGVRVCVYNMYTYTDMHEYIHIYTYTYIYEYIHSYMNIYICIYIHMTYMDRTDDTPLIWPGVHSQGGWVSCQSPLMQVSISNSRQPQLPPPHQLQHPPHCARQTQLSPPSHILPRI